jgi:hypothetical protein
VPIETEVVRSPGWLMLRLARQLTDASRVKRLNLLDDYMRGNAPLPIPVASAKMRDSFEAFLRKARSNFAGLVVEATRERMTPTGFRTSADGDETGDAEAWRIWQRAGLDVESVDVHAAMLGLSESYVIVGNIDPITKVPVITFEDPRQVITVNDPAHRDRVLYGLKLYYDEIEEITRAFLYVPGRVYAAHSVARSKRAVGFTPRSWVWDEERGGIEGQALPHDQVPVVKFANYNDMGEFEAHVDLLDRINHQILQRMVIATMQAFRQRAVKGLPEKNEAGEVLDYQDAFNADPGSLWQVPEGVDFWESSQADLTPILAAVDRDVQHLGAVSRTPMHMLMPSGANQSAEGATMQREGLVFKVEDRIVRASQSWSRVMALAFLVLGDADRADLDKLQVIWRDPERRSLSERADAFTKLSSEKLPFRTSLVEIMGFPLDQVDRVVAEKTADQVAASLFAPQPAVTEQPQDQEEQPADDEADPNADQG